MQRQLTVFLADDNVIVREGVRALLELEDDIAVVGSAEDLDGVVTGAETAAPDVLVTDIRMPPGFSDEGIAAAREVRKRHPGTGVVVLSQFDDPSYAIGLLADGPEGTAYLLKDAVAEGGQLAAAVRTVAAGGQVLDERIARALANPVRDGLDDADDALLADLAAGRHVKAIAAASGTTAEEVDTRIGALLERLAARVTAGDADAVERLRLLHRAIVARDEQDERVSRLLPEGVADQLRAGGRRPGETEELEVTVLMSDIRGYSTIAERTDPTTLAHQLHEHRAAMNGAVHTQDGTVMQFVGDAVMAVFGAPAPRQDHAAAAVGAATAMHVAQREVNRGWVAAGLEPFGLGIGLSTGTVAAALLGSEDRLEYSVVGDVVNLAARLQQWAAAGETVLSDATRQAVVVAAEPLPAAQVKGRSSPVHAHRVPATAGAPG